MCLKVHSKAEGLDSKGGTKRKKGDGKIIERVRDDREKTSMKNRGSLNRRWEKRDSRKRGFILLFHTVYIYGYYYMDS